METQIKASLLEQYTVKTGLGLNNSEAVKEQANTNITSI